MSKILLYIRPLSMSTLTELAAYCAKTIDHARFLRACCKHIEIILVLCKLRFCHLRLRLRQKKLRLREKKLRQKILGLCKFVKIGIFYSLNGKHHLCFLFSTSHSSH